MPAAAYNGGGDQLAGFCQFMLFAFAGNAAMGIVNIPKITAAMRNFNRLNNTIRLLWNFCSKRKAPDVSGTFQKYLVLRSISG
ncbi:hypothetical protein [Desulfotomaculum copahuensis]|uniref:hypothetical protein n=1 Tax=Desulfotomaculum copahuensis TaxID=1838280 RepID=UPI0013725109|nr:hypothetical protein [Desulfotomaculum copahuensis]